MNKYDPSKYFNIGTKAYGQVSRQTNRPTSGGGKLPSYNPVDYFNVNALNQKKSSQPSEQYTADYNRRLEYGVDAKVDELSQYGIDAREPKKRGILDRLIDGLQIGQYATMNALYNITDKDPNTTALKGLIEGIKSGNPFGEDVKAGERSFVNILSNLGWERQENPDGKWYNPLSWNASNVARSVVGLAGDIFLDPLNYINPIAGASKALTGTGTKVGKSVVPQLTEEVAERVLKKLGADLTIKNTGDMIRRVNKLGGIANIAETGGGITLGLKNVPFLDALTNGKYNVDIVSERAIREFGDRTVAPYVNEMLDWIRDNPILRNFNSKYDYQKLARTNPEVMAKTLGIDDFKQANTFDLRKANKALREEVVSMFKDVSKEEQKLIANVLETIENWKPQEFTVEFAQTKEGKKLLADLKQQRLSALDTIKSYKLYPERVTEQQVDAMQMVVDVVEDTLEKMADVTSVANDVLPKSEKTAIDVLENIVKPSSAVKSEDVADYYLKYLEIIKGRVTNMEDFKSTLNHYVDRLSSAQNELLNSLEKKAPNVDALRNEVSKLQGRVNSLVGRAKVNNLDIPQDIMSKVGKPVREVTEGTVPKFSANNQLIERSQDVRNPYKSKYNLKPINSGSLHQSGVERMMDDIRSVVGKKPMAIDDFKALNKKDKVKFLKELYGGFFDGVKVNKDASDYYLDLAYKKIDDLFGALESGDSTKLHHILLDMADSPHYLDGRASDIYGYLKEVYGDTKKMSDAMRATRSQELAYMKLLNPEELSEYLSYKRLKGSVKQTMGESLEEFESIRRTKFADDFEYGGGREVARTEYAGNTIDKRASFKYADGRKMYDSDVRGYLQNRLQAEGFTFTGKQFDEIVETAYKTGDLDKTIDDVVSTYSGVGKGAKRSSQEIDELLGITKKSDLDMQIEETARLRKIELENIVSTKTKTIPLESNKVVEATEQAVKEANTQKLVKSLDRHIKKTYNKTFAELSVDEFNEAILDKNFYDKYRNYVADLFGEDVKNRIVLSNSNIFEQVVADPTLARQAKEELIDMALSDRIPLDEAKRLYKQWDMAVKNADEFNKYAYDVYGEEAVERLKTQYGDILFNDLPIKEETKQLVLRIKERYRQMGVDEVLINKLDINHLLEDGYSAHVLNPKALASKEFKKIGSILGFGKGFNPHDLTRKYQGTVKEINEQMFQEHGIKDFFIEEIAPVFLERAKKHNKIIYDTKFTEFFFNAFGVRVTEYTKVSESEKLALNISDLISYSKKHAREFNDKAIKHGVAEAITPEQVMEELGFGIDLLKNESPLIEVTKDQLVKLYGKKKLESVKVFKVPNVAFDKINKVGQIQFNNDTKALLTLYDKALHWWKMSVTSALPGFHGRNLGNNIFQNYLDLGFSALNPKTNIEAISILKGESGYIRVKGGKRISFEEVMQEAGRRRVIDEGLFAKDLPLSFSDKGINDLAKPTLKSRINPLDVQNFAPFAMGRTVGNAFENHARIANFVAHLKQGKTFAEASENSLSTLFDYSDLTEFERHFMKRAIPFYTWMRKNVPFQLEKLINNPSRHRNVFKILQAVENNVPESERVDKSYIGDHAESWIQTPFKTKNPEGRQEPVFWNPSLAFNDLTKIPNPLKPREAIRDLIVSSSPFIKIPIELASNKNFYFDTEIDRGNGHTKNLPSYFEPHKYFGKEATDVDATQISPTLEYLFSQLSAMNIVDGVIKKSGDDRALHILNNTTGIKGISYDYEKYKTWALQKRLMELENTLKEVRGGGNGN